ncbi:MAG: ABC transporter permease [Nocardioidaceae bacterium]|nr:ABC transporter permease [Nocardioidaceae bacterium]MCL2613460.1 ABC transporter permease [Nocardioidaceae bacterium]
MTSTPLTPGTPPPPPPPPPPGAAQAPMLNVSDTSGIPFWRLVLVEFRKSYDTRAGMWLLIAIGILVGLVEAFVLIMSLVHSSQVYLTDFGFIGTGLGSLLLPVLAVMLVTTEWSQRSAMVSFALEPRRIKIVMAKWLVAIVWVLVTLVVMWAFAVVMTAIAAVAQPDLTSWSGTSGSLPAFLPTVLDQILTMTIGFALGALLLNTPAAIVVFFLYWYLLPGVLAAIGAIRPWLAHALEWINFRVAMSPFLDGSIHTGEQWGKILVSAFLWIALPLGFGIWRILRAEVK